MRTRMLGLAAASASAAALFASGAAADVPLSLSWSAPGGCPTRAQVIAEVERLLASRESPSSQVAASATIAKSGADYQLRMTIEGARGDRTRVLSAPTCGELADAAALILAIAINPSAIADAPKSARDGGVAAPKKPIAETPRPRVLDAGAHAPRPRAATPAPIAPPPPLRHPMKAPTRFMSIFTTLGADEGTFAGAAPSFGGGGAFVRKSLRLELSGHFTRGGRIATRSATQTGAELWRAGGAVAVCFDRSLDAGEKGAPRGAICAGFEAGAIHATGYGVGTTAHTIAPWLAPTVGGSVRWPLRQRLSLRFDLGVAAPIIEPVFRLVGVGTVHQVGAVSARGGIGVEVDIF